MVSRLNSVQLRAQSIVTSKIILFFVKSLNPQGKPNLTESCSKMKLCKSRLYTKLSGQSMKVLGSYRMKNGFIIDGPRILVTSAACVKSQTI